MVPHISCYDIITYIVILTFILTLRSVSSVIQSTEHEVEPSLWPYNDDTTSSTLTRGVPNVILDVNMVVWGQSHSTALLKMETASLHLVDAGDGSYTHIYGWGGEPLELDSSNTLLGDYNYTVYVDTFTDTTSLSNANDHVETAFGDVEPHKSFAADQVFIITFEDVTWKGGDELSPTNTLQLVFLVDTGGRKTYVEIDYGHIEWYGKTESDPKLEIGISRFSGSCDELTFLYQIPWTTKAELISQIKQGNSNLDKRWIFPLFTNCDSSSCTCSSCPCVHGTCEYVTYGFKCTCSDGYTGVTCEVNIDDCDGIDCGNGACVDALDSYSCKCCNGYSGDACGTNTNDCTGATCGHGKCLDFVGDHTCQCEDGYSGNTCSVTTTHCTANLCHNGGTCEETICSYSCSCPDGVTGNNCETDGRPAVGTMSSWGSWSDCSKTCDNGYRVAYRQCERDPCQQDNHKKEACSKNSCSEDATETTEAMNMTLYKTLLEVATEEESLKTYIADKLNAYCASNVLCCAIVIPGSSTLVTSAFTASDVKIAKGYPKPSTAIKIVLLLYVDISSSMLTQKCSTGVEKRAADPSIIHVPKTLLAAALGQQLGDNSQQEFCCATLESDSGVVTSTSNSSSLLIIILCTVLPSGVIILILLTLSIYYVLRRNDEKIKHQLTSKPPTFTNAMRMTPGYTNNNVGLL